MVPAGCLVEDRLDLVLAACLGFVRDGLCVFEHIAPPMLG